MGDDAELYWEMEHNPYFWDEVEKAVAEIIHSLKIRVRKRRKPFKRKVIVREKR